MSDKRLYQVGQELEIDAFTLVRLAAQYAVGNAPTEQHIRLIKSHVDDRFSQEELGNLAALLASGGAEDILEQVPLMDMFNTQEGRTKYVDFLAVKLMERANPHLAGKVNPVVIRRHITNMGIIDQYRPFTITPDEREVPGWILAYDPALAKEIIYRKFRGSLEKAPNASQETLKPIIEEIASALEQEAGGRK